MYGKQLEGPSSGPGREKLYPLGAVDPVPEWIQDLVVAPLEEAGVVPRASSIRQ